jgi:xanthine/CO dehydrogenase XdhC/CoxF family maturation factor
LYLGAVTPEEIALSVMSQIVALRRGGTAAKDDRAIDAIIRQCEADYSASSRNRS